MTAKEKGRKKISKREREEDRKKGELNWGKNEESKLKQVEFED
jgi:hypothetical protein